MFLLLVPCRSAAGCAASPFPRHRARRGRTGSPAPHPANILMAGTFGRRANRQGWGIGERRWRFQTGAGDPRPHAARWGCDGGRAAPTYLPARRPAARRVCNAPARACSAGDRAPARLGGGFSLRQCPPAAVKGARTKVRGAPLAARANFFPKGGRLFQKNISRRQAGVGWLAGRPAPVRAIFLARAVCLLWMVPAQLRCRACPGRG
ncbi:unnamed protein product [Amoebophrya sp. A120]|nr:unnamed protein product [Amoebophrya sp. A120]|eukprot:GSA120T00023144001.1